MKYFTVEEAEALIPALEKIFAAIAQLTAHADGKAAAVRRLEETDPAQAAIELSQLQFLSESINEQLQSIAEMGAFPKGVNPALVDFPHRLEGRDVYLCWRLGEKAITHYHGIHEGFEGRKSL